MGLQETDTNQKSFKTCIVVPCYNEEGRLPLEDFDAFLQSNTNVVLCFVNDGSSDGTEEVLQQFQKGRASQVEIVSYEKNAGKAEAVRRGMHYSIEGISCDYIAYLDADLATAPEECLDMTKHLDDSIHFVFGSRIMKIGSVIDRRPYRFLVGRVIATIISNILKLKVYDTQCGCKVFTKDLAAQVFIDPFVSRWLFDVEIFQRIIAFYGRDKVLNHMLEIPLKKWTDVGESRIKATYFFKLWLDLYRIKRQYKKTNKKTSIVSGTLQD